MPVRSPASSALRASVHALLAAACLGVACAPKTAPTPPAPEAPVTPDLPPPPPTATGDVVDVFYGTEVADPYRWLEDLDSAETSAWVGAQAAYARQALDGLAARPWFAARLAEMWQFERFGLPTRKGATLLYSYNDGTMDQPQILVEVDGAPAKVLLDANTLSPDGTVAIASLHLSKDGTKLAYSLADAGSDWRTFKVRDVATGADLPDEIRWAKFTQAAWLPDGSGFFYARFPEPDPSFEAELRDQTVWFHRLGTPQADDVLVYAIPSQPRWGFWPEVTDDGRFLAIQVSEGTDERSRYHLLPLRNLKLGQKGGNAGGTPIKLLDAFDAAYAMVGQKGDTFWFRTDKDAPRYRVIAVDVKKPEPRHWREIIPQTEETLEGVSHIGGHLVATYLKDAASLVRVHTMDGAVVRDVALPGLSTVGGFGGSAESPETWYATTSFADPGTQYRYDVVTGESTLHRRPSVPGHDPDAYETVQVRYTSKDGTEVPMFITAKKGTPRDGKRPTLLYGYGGFNISITPGFRVMNAAWLEAGGVYAVANLRGGGEYGAAWHDAGTKLNKQNVFDDFIAAGEWLVANGWTAPAHLGIHGRSNGGLLVGATLVQRPDLFGAAIPGVGVLDMLRYQRFTIGWAWASDYGTVDDSEEMFRYLLAYSPVHNARPAAYPPTLIHTADHDDRVVPGHSYKFAAALQASQQGDAPVLIRIETRAGHGAGTPVSMLVAEDADKLAFLAEHLGLTPPAR